MALKIKLELERMIDKIEFRINAVEKKCKKNRSKIINKISLTDQKKTMEMCLIIGLKKCLIQEILKK